jgi:hypothetical protein
VWDALRQLWNNRTPEAEEPLHAFFEPDGVKWIYTEGTSDPERISPDNWNLDLEVLARPNTRRINLDLFYDYRTNVDQYPTWHEYLRRRRDRRTDRGVLHHTSRSDRRRHRLRRSASSRR